MKTPGARLSTNRFLLRAIYYPWVALPFPVRKVVTTVGIRALLLLRRARGIERQLDLTAPEKAFSLSFWGIPRVDPEEYALTISGSVRSPLTLSREELKSLAVVERQVSLDCVGGSRNNWVMRGVSFETLMDRAQPERDARTAVFRCADGYFTTHPLEDLIDTAAFLAYATNGQEIPAYGYPLRLVAPGKYGYKWAKWVVHIEVVSGSPKGFWERRSLPDRAWVGDVR